MSAARVPIRLPRLTLSSERSLESVLQGRRSVREYSREPLTHDEVAQLLWAAQGVTGPEGLRTAPSAGALYPLEVDVVVGDVDGLPSAIYRYRPDRHELVVSREGDRRRELRAAALGQDCVGAAAAVIALAAVYERTSAKYGERGIRYVHMEVGHAAQNVCLQAAALGLGAVVVRGLRGRHGEAGSGSGRWRGAARSDTGGPSIVGRGAAIGRPAAKDLKEGWAES